eukprot:7994379-Pyramimonas_sp.AAC.1
MLHRLAGGHICVTLSRLLEEAPMEELELWFLKLETKQSVVAVGVIYDLFCSRETIERIRAVSEFLGTLAIPWILVGDFNIPSGAINLSGFPQLARARTLVPDNTP